MTKKERDAIQKYFNKMNDYEKEADEAFYQLQELNGNEGTGHRWCCAETNYKDLLSCGHDYGYLFIKYTEGRAKSRAILELGRDLADLGFWRN